MIELGTLALLRQVSGAPGPTRGGRSGPAAPQDTGFAALFRQTGAKRDVSALRIQTDLTGEKELPETALPSEEEIPDELAALAGPSIISYQQSGPAPTPEEAPDQDKIVSILEGNMDIEAPPIPAGVLPRPADFAAQAAEGGAARESAETGEMPAVKPNPMGEETAARMPKAPEQSEAAPVKRPDAPLVTQEETPQPAPDAAQGGPCPLENENDTAGGGENAEEKPEKKDASRVFTPGRPMDIAPERVASMEKLASAARAQAAPATAETLFDTMVERIETARAAESPYMEIQLRPEILGKVAIRLTLGDAGLEIRIKADDPGVKSLIAGQISQLGQSLAEKGVKVAALDVTHTNVADHAFGDTGARDGGGQNRYFTPQKAAAASLGFGLGFTEEGEPAPALDTGLSSVEYRA